MWLLLLTLFCVGMLEAASCVKNSFSNPPTVPTIAYPGSYPVGVNYIQNHWSESVTLLRPENTVDLSQTNCPHDEVGLRDWHDPSVWGGNVPTSGNVNIPANTKILISNCSIPSGTQFDLIKIPVGSSLVFGDTDISISATGFYVSGSLLIGSPSCRIRSFINITLRGSRPQTLPQPDYVKGIFVDGIIDMHAVEYFPTWTRLAKTASPGDDYLFIQDCPNWKPGQSIALATTELKDTRDWHRNEQFIIENIYTTTISSTVCAIKLTTKVQYTHYGGSEYQAEVSLLNRNILVQGSALDSEPTDTTPIACTTGASLSYYPCEDKFLTGYGAHMMVTLPATRARFSGVEVFRGGQTNILGRYPFHFHMLGNLTEANQGNFYVSDCSVHRSFFRCYTIHGTSGTTLENGVTVTKSTGFDVIGHCFFCSEDGVEENHTVTYNFGAHIHPLGPFWRVSEGVGGNFGSQETEYVTSGPNLALADDISAAPFYFTNARSKIVGNAASGGWAGFAFPNLDAPVGLHTSWKPWFSPRNRPLIEFKSNSAHSTGFWQGHAAGIYLGGNLYVNNQGQTVYTAGRRLPARDTCNDARQGSSVQPNWQCLDPVWLRFEDTKVFLTNVGLQSWGDRCEIIRFEVHDAAISTNVFGEVWIDKMVVNCRSKHRPQYLQGATNATSSTQIWSVNPRDRAFFTSWVGFQFYDTGQSHILTDTTFKNCQRTSSPDCKWQNGGCDFIIWNYLTHSDQFTPGIMQSTRNVTYENVNFSFTMVPSTKKADKITVSGRDASWLDMDGTVTGDFPGQRTMIGSDWSGPDWWRYNDRCVNKNNNWVCPLSEGDSVVSVVVHWNPAREGEIGGSQCPNGGNNPCDIGGRITHFGRGPTVDTTKTFDIALMGRVTGPIIASQGGWHMQFIGGTPRVLTFAEMQVDSRDLLHIAIPYPRGTTFNIYAKACNYMDQCNPDKGVPFGWCNTCFHKFVAVQSIAEVRDKNSGADRYFYDSNTQLLHIRLATLEWSGTETNTFLNWPNFGTYDSLKNITNPLWSSSVLKTKYFSRGGVALLVSGRNNIPVVVEATNCGNQCGDVTTSVPAAMPINVVPTVPTRSPTYAPTTASPTRSPTNAPTEVPLGTPTDAPTTPPPTQSPPPTTAFPTMTLPPQPTNAPTNAPTLPRCAVYTDCVSCLSNDCSFCPSWENPNLQFHCQEKTAPTCVRERSSSCEDTLDQIIANWTAAAGIINKIRNKASGIIDITISRVGNPVLATTNLSVTVYFTSNDNSWSEDQQNKAKEIINEAVAETYGINLGRMFTEFLQLSKRAIADGQAQVYIQESSNQPVNNQPNNGWIAAVVICVLFAVIVVFVVIGLLFYMKKKKASSENY